MAFESYTEETTTTSHETTTTTISAHESSSSSHSESSSEEEEKVFNTQLQAIMDVFIMSIGDVIGIYNKLLNIPHHAILAKVIRFIMNIFVYFSLN